MCSLQWVVTAALPLALLVVLALFVVHQCLLEPSHCEDERLGLGVARQDIGVPLPVAR